MDLYCLYVLSLKGGIYLHFDMYTICVREWEHLLDSNIAIEIVNNQVYRLVMPFSCQNSNQIVCVPFELDQKHHINTDPCTVLIPEKKIKTRLTSMRYDMGSFI